MNKLVLVCLSLLISTVPFKTNASIEYVFKDEEYDVHRFLDTETGYEWFPLTMTLLTSYEEILYDPYYQGLQRAYLIDVELFMEHLFGRELSLHSPSASIWKSEHLAQNEYEDFVSIFGITRNNYTRSGGVVDAAHGLLNDHRPDAPENYGTPLIIMDGTTTLDPLAYQPNWSYSPGAESFSFGHYLYRDTNPAANSVPIPATTWLFLSSLLGLVGIRRFK